MSELFTRVKAIPTPDVLQVFFPGLKLKRDGSGREKALCLFHAEDTPSFTVFQDGFKCFGCGTHGSNVDLLLKAGLASKPLEAARMIAERFGIPVDGKTPHKAKRLTLSDYADYVKLPPDFLTRTFHLEETPKGIAFPYKDESGHVVGVQIRHRLEKGKGKDARFSWGEGKPYIYGAWALSRWKEKGIKSVLICEGASDVQVSWHQGIPALGVPGASAFKAEWTSLVLPFSELCIIQEPGEAGQKFVKSICAALKEASYQSRVKAVSLSEKDPRDLWLNHGERFKEELEAAISRAPVVDLYPAIPLTKDLILKVADLLKRHVFFKDQRLPLLIAIWVLGTYVYKVFTWFGYLWVNSPLKGCGKSLLLDVLRYLCWQATSRLTNPTEAVIFRLAGSGRTLILDELENLRAQDRDKYGAIMSVLNDGFHEGGTVPRNEKVEGKFVVVEYSTYCPKALAGINSLIDTIAHRSFKIPMVRKTKNERVERFNLRKQGEALKRLTEEMSLWAEVRKPDIEAVYDGIEEIGALVSLDDRLKDISEPLVAIATYADVEAVNGQERIVPELISLLLDMAGKRSEGERQEGIGAFTLMAEEILEGQPEKFIPSTELLEKVKEVDELSWVASTRSLGTFLRKFDLSHTKRRGPEGKQVRGYLLAKAWVEEAKSRYLVLIPNSEVSLLSLDRSGSGSEGNFACVPDAHEGQVENEPQTRAWTGRGT